MKFVMQPTPDTCTSACLAMLTGADVQTVIEEFHADWKSTENKINPSTYLSKRLVGHNVLNDPFNNLLEWDKVYLLTVPSLNIDGGLHHIVIDLRNDFEVVLDPNRGRDSRRYYIGWSDEPRNNLEVRLHAWLTELEVVPAESSKRQGGG